MRLCSVSVDLDEIACYSAIHGLAGLPECYAVYDLALERIRAFAASLSLDLTLFVVARDLEREQNRVLLRHALSEGHEIGNHSLDHFYDLTRRSRAEQQRQVLDASAAIYSHLGVEVSGFRAPGYTVTDVLLSVLRDSGMRYDSSVFPCPLYYGAKAALRGGMQLLGRKSRSVLDTTNVLRAPLVPYRSGTPYWKRGNGLLELPIQVVGPVRLPFIGTSLCALGAGPARVLTRQLLGSTFVNLELHGIDFLEAADVPIALRRAQPDLRLSLSRKLDALAAVIETLRAERYAFVRLDEAAAVLAARCV